MPVNTAELQRIRALVGSLAKPLASCPGAERLASFRQALTQLSAFPAASLESEMLGALDICNHRLDSWFTSLASRRLATLRATAPTGVVIGGWGCLQDVRRPDPVNPQQRAEFIHTPSLDQAAAAAVLRSGARRAHRGGSHHADIDLSSRRVRLARWILEGIRNGRSLNELLGVRFERAVKGTTADAALAAAPHVVSGVQRNGRAGRSRAAPEGRPSLEQRGRGSRRRGTERGTRCRRRRAHRRSRVSDRERQSGRRADRHRIDRRWRIPSRAPGRGNTIHRDPPHAPRGPGTAGDDGGTGMGTADQPAVTRRAPCSMRGAGCCSAPPATSSSQSSDRTRT